MLEDRRAIRRADVGDVGLVEKLGRERGGLDGDGLGRRRVFAGRVGGGDGLVLDLEEGLTGLSIKQEYISGFGDLSDGVDSFAVMGDCYEVGVGG